MGGRGGQGSGQLPVLTRLDKAGRDVFGPRAGGKHLEEQEAPGNLM